MKEVASEWKVELFKPIYVQVDSFVDDSFICNQFTLVHRRDIERNSVFLHLNHTESIKKDSLCSCSFKDITHMLLGLLEQ